MIDMVKEEKIGRVDGNSRAHPKEKPAQGINDMEKQDFAVLFGTKSDLVVAVREGRVFAFNAAAKSALPSLEEGAAADDIFPRELLESVDETFGAVRVGDAVLSASAATYQDVRLVTVYPAARPDEGYIQTIRSVSMAIKDAVNIFHMASGILRRRTGQIADPKIRHYFAIMEHSHRLLTRTAGHLSEVCFGGGAPLHISCFDMVELCRNTVETVNYLACSDRKGILFDCDERSLTYCGDEGKIEELILNLLSNSIKYTPADGVIKLTLRATQDGARLTVSDNGAGVDDEAKATLFSEGRGRRDVGDTKAGVGLGLPLVQRIANLHGGSAVLESRRGEGTVVTVQLQSMPHETVLRSPSVPYNAEGLARPLTELADILTYESYYPRNMD